MANFETSYESQKWDALAQQAKQTFDQIGKGLGDDQDLERAEVLVAKMGDLASSVIGGMIRVMKAQAQDRVRDDEEHRIAKGGPAYTPDEHQAAYTEAVKDIIASEGIELAIAFDDMLKVALEAQTQDLKNAINDSPTLTDQQENLLSRIAHMTGRPSPTAQNPLKKAAAALTGGTDDILLRDVHDMVSNMYHGTGGTSVEIERINESLEGIENRLGGLKDKADERDDPKEEDSRIRAWIRGLKNSWLGQRFGKAKDAAVGFGVGLLMLAARYIGLLLTDPNTWKTIGEFFSGDKLSEYASSFVKYMEKKVKDLLAWISAQLGIDGENMTEEETVFSSFADNKKQYSSPEAQALQESSNQKSWYNFGKVMDSVNAESAEQKYLEEQGQDRDHRAPWARWILTDDGVDALEKLGILEDKDEFEKRTGVKSTAGMEEGGGGGGGAATGSSTPPPPPPGAGAGEDEASTTDVDASTQIVGGATNTSLSPTIQNNSMMFRNSINPSMNQVGNMQSPDGINLSPAVTPPSPWAKPDVAAGGAARTPTTGLMTGFSEFGYNSTDPILGLMNSGVLSG